MRTFRRLAGSLGIFIFSHEAAEAAGLLSYAFGEDGVDRHVRVYKKEHAPCEDELACRRKGEPWNEQVKQKMVAERAQQKQLNELESKRKPEKIVPNTNYKDKYAHLIGHDAALDAAKKTETNKSYGFGTFRHWINTNNYTKFV